SISVSARFESGLFVGAPSVVRPPPRRAPIEAKAATIRTTHTPTVRHGCRALARAIASVESLMLRLDPPVRAARPLSYHVAVRERARTSLGLAPTRDAGPR